MSSLFGIPLSNIMIALLALVALAFGLLGWIGYRNPLLIRMGLRNAARRKTQTALIVIGLMLSTLIISAAFATGDTVGYSLTSTVYRDFREADIVIGFDDEKTTTGVEHLTEAHLASIRSLLANDPAVDGLTGVLQEQVPSLNLQTRLSEPRTTLVGVDPATVDEFHGLIGTDGATLSASALGHNEVYATRRLAEDIGLSAGSDVTIYFDNQPHVLHVRAIVEDNALSTRTVLSGNNGQPAGGLVASMADVRAITGEQTQLTWIVISATGGVHNSMDVVNALDKRVEFALNSSSIPAKVQVTKAEIVRISDLAGSFFVTFFLVFGLFSIAAGIMLIFLTFVMLAAERRSEMGMSRAVGMKRLHLTESFLAEGMAYNVGSALIGALLGLGVAYLLILVMGSVFSNFGLNIAYHVNPQGFVIAYCLGVVITFATVTFSSWRAANLNIVRAIRDLPEPQPLRGRDRTVRGLLLASVGVGWYLLWLLVLGAGGLLAFGAFIFGLATYGLGWVAGALVIAAFVAGARLMRRVRARRWQTAALVVWWVAFNAVALLTWFLLRTRGWANLHRNAGGWAVWMVLIGSLAIWWGGWVVGQAFAYTAGTTLLILALAMLAVYFGAEAKPSFSIASIALLWYWLLPLPFSLFLERAKGWNDPLNGLASVVGLGHDRIQGNIEMFFVSGICITAAATLFVIFNSDLLLGALNGVSRVLGGATPAIRTAIAYPLASKFRTGMTLAMFGLVVFSLVVMATLNSNFSQFFLGDAAKGGFDVAVTGNPNNRIPDLRTALSAAGYDVSQIRDIGTLRGTMARMKTASEDDDRFAFYGLQGMDAEFAQSAKFPLSARAEGYASDADVFRALLADPTLAIVDESRIASSQAGSFGGPGNIFTIPGNVSDLKKTPWAPIPIVVRNAATGDEVDLNVIGIVDGAVTGVEFEWAAVFVNESVVQDHFGGGEVDYFYLTTRAGGNAAAKSVADGVEAALLERGVQATSIQESINTAAAQGRAFQLLFEGFMGLGLIVGIAALGVIAFRTVAERRQQIGMLRAIGYSRRLVALSFFLESSFIAVTGIGSGLILGAALSYNLLTSPEFTNGAVVDFALPWLELAVIVGIAYGASALMTLIPARSASRVAVAEALRYSG